MLFQPCVFGCVRYLVPGDGPNRCLTGLGSKHAEVAFVDEYWSHCRKMTILELCTRLRYLERGGASLPLPQSSSHPSGCQVRTTSSSCTGGLRVIVVANPPGNQHLGDHLSSCAPQPVELPKERPLGPLQSAYQWYLSKLLPTTGRRSLHQRGSFLERKIPEKNPEMRDSGNA